MTPAHDDVASVRRVAVVSEIPALELELDSYPLPLARIYLTLCLAIRVTGLNGFNVIPQFTSDHAEEEHNALLVDWLMTEPTEVDRVPVSRAVLKFGVSMPSRERRRGTRLSRRKRRGCCKGRPGILDGKKSHYVGPLRLAVCELAELRRNRRPRTKPPLEDAGAVGAVSAVLVASGNTSDATNELPPVFEKNLRVDENVGRVRLQASRPDGFPSAREVLEDLVLRHAR